jgi:hypothetical protein
MSNQYVIDGLRSRLAEIQATIRATEQRLRTLAHDKATVAGALRLFENEANPDRVSLGIQSGAFARTILDTLREAGEPLSARGIAEALVKGKTLERADFNMLIARVRNALPRLSDRLDGEKRERTTYWRISGDLPPG